MPACSRGAAGRERSPLPVPPSSRGLRVLLAVLACGGVHVDALRGLALPSKPGAPPPKEPAGSKPDASSATVRYGGKHLTVEEAEDVLAKLRPHPHDGHALGGQPGIEGVRFVKIQKTGSSSLGDVIIPHFCRPGEQCIGGIHMDWTQATKNGTYRGRVVTLLRDPVDRTLSEFFYLRDTDGHNSMTQGQWDFRNRTWLSAIQDENLTKALDAYIHGDPKSPSRNRQALYILGFRDGRTPDFDDKTHKAPGEVYDWDTRPGGYVRKAMEHLENMTVFGITDCWVASMRAIATALHWDQNEMRQFYSQHERNGRAQVALWRRRDHRLLKDFVGKRGLDNTTRWSELIPREWVLAIKRWNNVDMQLYGLARRRFEQKFNTVC